MSMSSRLQEQGAAELKKWKHDRDVWQQEKDQLLCRIASLEADGGLSMRLDQDGSPTFVATKSEEFGSLSTASNYDGSLDARTSPSVERLREEIRRLRARNHEAETSLQCWLGDSIQVDKVLRSLGEVGERMRTRREGSARESSMADMVGEKGFCP